MSDRALLESSLLPHRDSATYMLSLLRSGPQENLAVSRTFLEMLETEPEEVSRRLGYFLEIPPGLIDGATLRQLTPKIRNGVQTYRTEGRIDESTLRTMRERVEDDFVAQVLYEEWAFLTSQSWIFSKQKISQTYGTFPPYRQPGASIRAPASTESPISTTAVAMVPPYNTARITVQRGAFTIHGGRPEGIETLKLNRLAKATIPQDAAIMIKRDLRGAGVTDFTVFPELDGLAREICAVHIEGS